MRGRRITFLEEAESVFSRMLLIKTVGWVGGLSLLSNNMLGELEMIIGCARADFEPTFCPHRPGSGHCSAHVPGSRLGPACFGLCDLRLRCVFRLSFYRGGYANCTRKQTI
jgi:hypothetical protein